MLETTKNETPPILYTWRRGGPPQDFLGSNQKNTYKTNTYIYIYTQVDPKTSYVCTCGWDMGMICHHIKRLKTKSGGHGTTSINNTWHVHARYLIKFDV